MIARIKCPKCNGHGDVALPAPYLQTLIRIPANGVWRSTAVVLQRHMQPKPSRTALINRLNALARWGLVERCGNGRSLKWRRSP